MKKKFKIGYTQGVYDMFHIGHLNILNRAKEQCEYLIVGVNSDRLVEEYKHKRTVIKQCDRATIVENIKAVDKCVIVDTLDKVKILQEYHFEAIFIGDDWQGNPRWVNTKEELRALGVDVVFLPYTEGVSSSALRTVEEEHVEEDV